MKKVILVVLAMLLVFSLTACGSRGNENNTGTNPGTQNNGTVRPEDDNGMVQDENGIIGDKDPAQNGVLPEVGGEIEQGANDVIDEVGDAIDGNDNNAGNADNSFDAGSGSRTRGRNNMN